MGADEAEAGLVSSGVGLGSVAVGGMFDPLLQPCTMDEQLAHARETVPGKTKPVSACTHKTNVHWGTETASGLLGPGKRAPERWTLLGMSAS